MRNVINESVILNCRLPGYYIYILFVHIIHIFINILAHPYFVLITVIKYQFHDSSFFNHTDLNSYFESLNSYFESLNSYFESLNSYFESLNSYIHTDLIKTSYFLKSGF